MSDIKISLIDLGDVSGAVAQVVCRFMDMLERGAGYIAPPKVARDAKYDAEAEFIKEIAGNTNLNPVVRSAAISNLKKEVKAYMNQTNVIAGAIPLLKTDANPEMVDEDWISLFMDKVKLISDTHMQLLWSQLLAQEMNEPSSISRQLLWIFFQMSKTDAEKFEKLTSICVEFWEDGKLFEATPVIDVGGATIERDFGIFYDDITNLESFGLIKLNENNPFYYRADEEWEMKYFNKRVLLLKSGETVVTGKVSFTKSGFELYKICEKKYDEKSYQYICETLDLLKQLNYFV